SMDMPNAVAVWDKREWSTEAADKEIECGNGQGFKLRSASAMVNK
ncbi:hypothetical protein A2U01_0098609, partial [Trifolium medium]|nr:hypothetical protein [Trifolium medium]